MNRASGLVTVANRNGADKNKKALRARKFCRSINNCKSRGPDLQRKERVSVAMGTKLGGRRAVWNIRACHWHEKAESHKSDSTGMHPIFRLAHALSRAWQILSWVLFEVNPIAKGHCPPRSGEGSRQATAAEAFGATDFELTHVRASFPAQVSQLQ